MALLFVPLASAATTDSAAAAVSPGPYLVNQPITFTSTTACTVFCGLVWTDWTAGRHLGDHIGDGASVTQAFTTPGLKTVQLDLRELCVGTSQSPCHSFAYVSVDVVDAVGTADTTAPTITVSGLEVEATGPSTVVNYSFDASDPSGVKSKSCTPASGSSFAVGDTMIECTAVDSNSNKATAPFTVVVGDTAPPTLTAPSGLAAQATSAAGAAVGFDVSATDLVDGAVTPTCSPASGSTFPLGTTTVTCAATDSHHNSSGTKFDVVVTQSAPSAPTPPKTTTHGSTPTLTVPDQLVVDAVSPAGAPAAYTVTATDSAGNAVTPDCSKASGSLFAIGSTTVTCSLADASTNVATTKTFTVQVRGAVAQLTDVLQVVQDSTPKSTPAEVRVKTIIRALARHKPAAVPQACRLIVDFKTHIRGSLGHGLTPAQRASVRSHLTRIYVVVGCARVLSK